MMVSRRVSERSDARGSDTHYIVEDVIDILVEKTGLAPGNFLSQVHLFDLVKRGAVS